MPRANFSDAELIAVLLDRAVLEEADLSGADLSGASMREVQGQRLVARGTSFRSVDAFNADLSGADLSEATFYALNGERLNLRGANLRGAVFVEAELTEVDLRDADLTGAEFSRGTRRELRINADTICPDGEPAGDRGVGQCL